jgi:hypothetical protein
MTLSMRLLLQIAYDTHTHMRARLTIQVWNRDPEYSLVSRLSAINPAF